MTTPLWAGAELVAAVGGTVRGTGPGAVSGVSIDSRSLSAGDAFFAIRGERLDGHDFVRGALEAGAALAVVENGRLDEFEGAGALVGVPDVLGALEDLGRGARARTQARVIAVTGSVGKTSTKQMLELALAPSGPTHASVASFNNHWGVPLTLARMPADSAFVVSEIGMNHAGEITPLTAMVRPHVAIITTVEPVHIEFFGSVEAIADAKAEIFEGVEPDGHAVLNADNPQFGRLRQVALRRSLDVRSFGIGHDCDARLLTVASLPQGSIVTANILGTDIGYRVGAPGRHHVQNSLAVLLAAKLAGADLAEAAAALAGFSAQAGRGKQDVLHTPTGEAVLFDESYNANPASMRAALALLGQSMVSGRRIAVLGDMRELGDLSEELHRDLAPVLAEAKVDLLFAAGPHMRALYDAVPEECRGAWAERAEDIEAAIVESIRGGDAIMIKGSLGSRMGPIVKALTRRFAGGASNPVHA